MKTMMKVPIALMLSAVLWSTGCQQTSTQVSQRRPSTSQVSQNRASSSQVSQKRTSASPAPAAAAPKAAAPKPAVAAAPLRVDCITPTHGLVSLAKDMPKEASLGQTFEYQLKLSSKDCVGNVVITDQVPAGASFVKSEPAAQVDGNRLSWRMPTMDAGQSQAIRVWLKADKEGTLASCAMVSADPRVCAATRVVNPAITLTKTEPKDVTLCDPIPVTLVVKNTGSSQLTGVKVTDNLPSGMTSDGKTTLVFDAGNLAPGESKEFKFNATAARTGKYVNPAEATSNEGVSAKASAATAVHQAVLAIVCKAREQQYFGRPFEVCLTVSNSGDVAAAGTQVVLPIPAGATFSSATAGGQVSGNNVVWDLGALAANAPKDVCATFTSTTAGTYRFNASAKGACATPVSTSCETKVMGISALLLEKSDNPDPIQVGETTTYKVKVTNQGTADDTNIKMVVEFPAEVDPVSASNGGVVSGKKVTFPAYPRLAPKAAFEYSITAKGAKAGDARVNFIRTSDDIPAPTSAEESTRVY
jgi:uncharacterized repeat protein (TIGR01451 family)